MISIAQSHFLGALGKAIGNSLWQVAALWLVYAAVSNAGQLSANRKYGLATGAGLAGFILFVVTFIYAYATAPLQPAAASIYAEAAADGGSAAANYWLYIYHSFTVSLQSLAPYISCAYLLMFLLLCIRLCNGFRQVHFFANEGLQKADLHLRLFVQQHAQVMGIQRQVKVFASQHIQSPLTLGFWKPIILMPVASLGHLTIAQAESILLHELAHIRRYDYLLNIFLQIAEISLFFNPFMRLLLKHVKQERENSCDDYVLQFQYCPKDYAKALLAIEHNNNTALLALAAGGTQSFQLLNRVKRMVSPQPKAFNYRQQLGLLLLFTVLTLGFTVIIPHPKKSVNSSNTAIVRHTTGQSMKKEIVAHAPVPQTEEVPAAPPPPPPPPHFNVIECILQNQEERVESERIVQEVNEEKIKQTEAEIEAIRRQMDADIKPVAQRIEAWGNAFARQITKDMSNTAVNVSSNGHLQELQHMGLDSIALFTEVYQKQITAKVAELVRLIPVHVPVTVFKRAPQPPSVLHRRNIIIDMDEEESDKTVVVDRRDTSRRMRKNKLVFQNAQQQLAWVQAHSGKWKQMQAQLLSLQDSARQHQLHLGLLTDDRDTTLALTKRMLAQVQNRYFHRSATSGRNHPVIPQEPMAPAAPRENCTITISDNSIKVTTNDGNEKVMPGAIQINGQHINIQHQERKSSTGKEEKVVVINISASR